MQAAAADMQILDIADKNMDTSMQFTFGQYYAEIGLTAVFSSPFTSCLFVFGVLGWMNTMASSS